MAGCFSKSDAIRWEFTVFYNNNMCVLYMYAGAPACLGHNDCCTEESPCPEGYGDCDNSHQCGAGLVCGENNCDPSFLPAGTPHKFNSGDDCCVRSTYLVIEEKK